MASRKSSTKVSMNAKISSINLQSIPTDGANSFVEGAPVKFGSQGYAAQPTAGDAIYVNFVDSSRADVMALQGDPFQDSLATRNTESGTLTGIRGNGCEIGLPAECWNGGVLPTIGNGVTVDGSSFLFKGESVVSGSLYYGIVERISSGKAFFSFRTMPCVLA